MGGPNSGARGRKTGDWIAVARGRENNRNRDIRTGRGVTNIPNVTDTGSAAYRRLVKRGK